jgi:hypothetical protein
MSSGGGNWKIEVLPTVRLQEGRDEKLRLIQEKSRRTYILFRCQQLSHRKYLNVFLAGQ